MALEQDVTQAHMVDEQILLAVKCRLTLMPGPIFPHAEDRINIL